MKSVALIIPMVKQIRGYNDGRISTLKGARQERSNDDDDDDRFDLLSLVSSLSTHGSWQVPGRISPTDSLSTQLYNPLSNWLAPWTTLTKNKNNCLRILLHAVQRLPYALHARCLCSLLSYCAIERRCVKMT